MRLLLSHRTLRPLPLLLPPLRLPPYVPSCLQSVEPQTNNDQSSVDPAPQTSFLQQTDSRGVITGGPAVATSQPDQPALDTSIPLLETSLPAYVSIPAQPSGINTVVIPLGRNSTTQVVVSANNSTTIVYGAPNTASGAQTTGTGKASGTGKESGSGATGSGATGSDASGSSKPSSTPGAAANLQVASGFLGAAFLAAFL